jgi:type I restriction enzyme S subunit
MSGTRHHVASQVASATQNGDLPDGWTHSPLGEVVELQPGYAFKSRWFSEDGVRLLRGTNIVPGGTRWEDVARLPDSRIEEFSQYLLGEGDIVIAMDRPVISSGLKVTTLAADDVPALLLQRVGRFKPGDAIDREFLFAFLNSRRFLEHTGALATGTQLPHISKTDIETAPTPLPPLAEQRRIVSKIESLQERSSRARRALSEVGPLLEQFRQSVLRAAFSGRLTADWRAAHRDVEPATELLSRIRTERRHRWEQSELAKYEAKSKKPPKNWQDKYDSVKKKAVRATVADVRADGVAIGEVPDGWELVRLGDIANLQAGYAFKSKWFTKTGIRLLRGTNIEPGSTRWTETVHLSVDQSDEYTEYLLNDGDVVIAMDRPVISTGLKVTRINESDLPALLLQRVGRFQIEDRITSEFIHQFVQSPFFMRHIGAQATGTQLPHISSNDIESAILPLPPLEEQAAIVESVSRAFEAVDAVESVLAESESALTQLDQSILAKAFRGELVPQDPRDEPASELLARIRTTREAEETTKPKRRKKKSAAATLQPTATLPTPATVQRSLSIEPQEEPDKQSPPVKKQPTHQQETPVPIDETNRNDVMASIRSVFSAHSEGLNREDAIRHLAHELGYKRTGSRIQEIVGNDLIAAQKRHIIHRDGDRYYLDCRSIEDYDRDDLVSLLQRAMGQTWWEESEAIKEATRLLGFRRTGRNITDTWKKTIALAIRRGELERDGIQIRRSR